MTTAAVEIATASSSAAAVARTRSNLTARPRSLELKRSILARNAAFCDLRGLLRAAALRFAWFIYSARWCSRSLRPLDVRGVHIISAEPNFFLAREFSQHEQHVSFILTSSILARLEAFRFARVYAGAIRFLLGSSAHSIGVSHVRSLSRMPQMARDAK